MDHIDSPLKITAEECAEFRQLTQEVAYRLRDYRYQYPTSVAISDKCVSAGQDLCVAGVVSSRFCTGCSSCDPEDP
jgi:hypothetical protein